MARDMVAHIENELNKIYHFLKDKTMPELHRSNLIDEAEQYQEAYKTLTGRQYRSVDEDAAGRII